MTPLLTFAQTTTYELAPSSAKMPPFLWTAFTAVNKVHGIWRWYRRIELYRNPNNLSQLLAGHILNFAIGHSVLVRIAAQCLLISTRVLECVQQQTILYGRIEEWKDAIKGNYPVPCRRSWKAAPESIWISPSAAGHLGSKSRFCWNYVERVVRCSLEVFVQAFKLSMHVMDAMDVFCLSPHTQNEGVNEFVVNAMKWMDKLVDNKEELLEGIESNKKIIERILIGSPITYDQLHGSVEATLEKTLFVHNTAKAIADFTNGTLVNFGKRALTGAMIVVGLPTTLLPTRLLPTA